MNIFVINDEKHDERIGEFTSFDLALTELKRIAEISWNKEPNLCSCSNWKNCSRDYEII